MRHSQIALVFVRLLVGDDDSLLLLRHAKWGDWGLPGGHIEPGESPLEAALRELHEELPLYQSGIGVQILPVHKQPIEWGPVPSRSAGGAPTRYRTWYFYAQFAAAPLRVFTRLPAQDIVSVPLRVLDVSAWPAGITDQLWRFAEAQPGGLDGLPLAWP